MIRNDTAALTPLISLNTTEPGVEGYCLSFYFLNRADNDPNGRLGGELFVGELIDGVENTIWSSDSQVTDVWTKAEVEVDPSDVPLQVGSRLETLLKQNFDVAKSFTCAGAIEF